MSEIQTPLFPLPQSFAAAVGEAKGNNTLNLAGTGLSGSAWIECFQCFLEADSEYGSELLQRYLWLLWEFHKPKAFVLVSVFQRTIRMEGSGAPIGRVGGGGGGMVELELTLPFWPLKKLQTQIWDIMEPNVSLHYGTQCLPPVMRTRELLYDFHTYSQMKCRGSLLFPVIKAKRVVVLISVESKYQS